MKGERGRNGGDGARRANRSTTYTHMRQRSSPNTNKSSAQETATTQSNRGVEMNRFYGASRCRRGRFGIGSVIDHNRL